MSVVGPRRMKSLLDAVVATSSGLNLEDTLRRITELAVDLVDARYGALGVLDASGTQLSEFITTGIDEDARRKIGPLPEGHGILGTLIVDAQPLRLANLGDHVDSFGFPPNHPKMRSFVGVPIRVGDKVFGNLYLTEKIDADEFSDVDEELLIGLSAAAGVAIENSRLHAKVAAMALAEDRERIARDLHDTVIQRLFAIGLSLQGTLPLIGDDLPTVRDRVDTAIDDLDETVKQIRMAIFSLESSRRAPHGLRDRVLQLCREASAALGFDPRVVFDGAVDSMVTDEATLDAAAMVQEALSNVAQHAQATQVEVVVAVESSSLLITVADNGVGLGDDLGKGKGLRNMADRAGRHSGLFDLSVRPPTGTVVTWKIPTKES